jgi:2-oxoglutarate dehydrogenase complex dehydrogenase (E1) component-like enzyme
MFEYCEPIQVEYGEVRDEKMRRFAFNKIEARKRPSSLKHTFEHHGIEVR